MIAEFLDLLPAKNQIPVPGAHAQGIVGLMKKLNFKSHFRQKGL